MDEILYGSGTAERIVSTEYIYGQENVMHVFYRDADGSVRSEYSKFKPYVYISKDDPVNKEFYKTADVTDLFGSNHYNRIVHSENYSFIGWIAKTAESCYKPFLQSQWMIATGNTQFKGMNFDDPLRLYLDIEVYTSGEHDFPNATRPDDKVIIITAHDNRGNDYLWRLDKYDNEKEMLASFVKDFREIDTDIIVLHSGFNFDLPYLRDRCRLHGVKFALGRDGSEPRTFETSIKFAEKSDQYENFHIYGRHVLDTFFMAKSYDQIARKLESYSLKYCAKFLGGIEGERTYVKGDEISWYWDNKRAELLKYAMDDVYETRLLDKNWGGVVFETTKMFPLPCQDVSRYGTGNKLELLFTRYYYNRLWSYPKPDPKESYGGGYTGVFRYGYIDKPSVYIDVSSLYPTVMALLGIQPPKDEMNLFQRLLELVREQRFIKKRQMQQEKDPQLKAKYNGEQNALKVILNSMYGFLGFAYGNFNYYKGASLTTEFGREIAKRMNVEIELLGGEVVRTDTDGSLAIVPKQFRGGYESELEFIKLAEENLNVWLQTEIKNWTHI